MAIEKALYQAPVGIDEEPAEDIEIEVVNPEEMSIGVDGMEIEIEPSEEDDGDFNANLAEFIPDNELTSLGSDLVADVEEDTNFR